MNYLLDTHILLWAMETDLASKDGFTSKASSLIDDPNNAKYFSPANIWEVAIKSGLQHSKLKVDPTTLLNEAISAGFLELPISSLHCAYVRKLPPLHKDPFDRLLIAQAQVENFTLLTVDPQILRYPGLIEDLR